MPAIKIAAKEIRLRKFAKLSKVRWIKLVVFSGKRTLISDSEEKISFRFCFPCASLISSKYLTLYSNSKKFSEDGIDKELSPNWEITTKSPNKPDPPKSGICWIMEWTVKL